MNAYGKENAEGVISCYVEALTTVKKGDVEAMCSKEAVKEGWEALTQNSLDELIATANE